MKKQSLLLLYCVFILPILFLCSCQNNNKFVIKGELNHSASGMIYLSETDFLNTRIIDSTEVSSKGQFKFKGKIKEPKFFQVHFGRNNFLLLLVEPGQKITLHADADYLGYHYKVSGSESSIKIKYLNDQLYKTRKTIDSILAIQDNHKYGKAEDTLFKHLSNIAYHTIKNQRNFSIKFIIENLHSLSAIVALYQQINDSTYVLNKNTDLQFINLASDTLMKYFPDNSAVKVLWADRVRLNKMYNAIRIYNLSSKAKRISYPDIALPGVNNDTVHLSKINSKCILVNFWSPLDVDCQYANKGLKEIYSQYKKKGFEIYNIALTSDKDVWLKLVNRGNVPGINVIDKKTENSPYLLVYNIKKLPASYLIGSNGDVVEKDIYGEKLKTRLKQILR
jgi:hypothetical protein